MPAANDELAADLEAAAQAQFAEAIGLESDPNDPNASPQGGEGDGSGSTGSVEPDPNLSSETPSSTPTPDTWQWDDGFQLTKDQARTYAELEAFLYSNPEKAEALRLALSGGDNTNTQGTGPAGETTTPPEISLDDITDPEVRLLAERLQAQEAELQQLRQSTTGVTDYVTTQQEQAAQSFYKRASTSFKESHNLTDDELSRVADVAARLNVLPSLMQPIDPVTGAPRTVDPLAAIEEALTTAYWQIPDFRTRAIAEERDQQVKDKARKQKLSSLSGNSGSVPKEAPVPKTEHDRRSAMIAEVANMMGRES